MKAKMNNTILRHVVKTIDNHPVWGLLIANEYLHPDEPLRKALVDKMKANFPDKNIRTSAMTMAIEGRTFKEIDDEIIIPILTREMALSRKAAVSKSVPFANGLRVYKRTIKRNLTRIPFVCE